MNKVAIVGTGQTPVREHWELPIRHLAVEALLNALNDNNHAVTPQSIYVGNMLSGALSEQEHLGALIADYAALEGTEAVKVEAACASGGAAFRQAVYAVASGTVDSAAIVGVEKLTEMSGKNSSSALATAADADYETSLGLSFVAINALIMRRYMYEYGYEKEDFAYFPAIAHNNAQQNPNAMFHFAFDKEQYRKSKMIADPINLLDSSPIADGAAAAIVVPLEKARKMTNKYVTVEACEVGTDTLALDNRKNPIYLKAVERSTLKAINTAGMNHKNIDFFELHDAFSIITSLSLEASGFCRIGEAIKEVQTGRFNIDGQLPITTHGGLKGRGHPVGATGMYQIVEAVQQLMETAPSALQLDDASVGMAQNIGGSGATVITTLLKRTG
ncbi:MAG: thiolase domain-containing protein [Caldithrix sp.]|nr:thiolase domain-containing protein [Caldithrix sp.]